MLTMKALSAMLIMLFRNNRPQKRRTESEKSVFQVSPDGGLATVLKTGKPVSNLRNFPTGTQVELVSRLLPFMFSASR